MLLLLTTVVTLGNQIQIKTVEVNSFNELTSTKAKVVTLNTIVCNIEELEFSICNSNGTQIQTVKGRISENIVDFTEQDSKRILVKLTVAKQGEQLSYIKAKKIPNVMYVKNKKDLVLVTENGVVRWK